MITRILSGPAGSEIRNSLFDILLNIILDTLNGCYYILLNITTET